MKKIISILLCLSLLTGCATNLNTGKSEISAEKVKHIASVVELAGYNGTYLYLKNNPTKKDIFVNVVNGLNTLIANEIQLEGFLFVVKELPIKELQSDEGVMIIDSAIILFGIYKDDLIHLDKLEQAKKLTPIAIALRDGINRALLRI